jgi:hypothetical protein
MDKNLASKIVSASATAALTACPVAAHPLFLKTVRQTTSLRVRIC